MPSGYTASIYEGKPVSFREFTMGCARGFGALIDMRDDPADAPIPDKIKPSEWYRRSLDEARREFDRVESLTYLQWEAERDEWYERTAEARREAEKKRTALRARYEDMLAQVQQWQPPTADHEELKTFMVDQLTQSIQFDCSFSMPEPTRPTVSDFAQQRREEAKRALARCEQDWEDEKARAASRTAWIDALRNSLAAQQQAPA